MPISVTCQCGARLEIDEKFLGKEIPCPDCQRPLPTQAPPKPPPLETPNYKRISGFAVLSLALALVFMFIPFGTIAAIVVGILALKQIAKEPNRLDGTGYARAGIILGGVFLFLSVVAMLSPFVFGIDRIMRELRMAGRIEYKSVEFYESEGQMQNNVVSLKRLSDRWAQWTNAGKPNSNDVNDMLILVNPTEDAYIAALNMFDINAQAAEDKQKKVIEHLYKSELMRILAELRGGATFERKGEISEKDTKLVGAMQEMVFDLRIGRVDRRFLIQYPANDKDVRVLVAVCRFRDFERMEPDFRTVFSTVDKKQP